jgi:hypothetical protein
VHEPLNVKVDGHEEAARGREKKHRTIIDFIALSFYILWYHIWSEMETWKWRLFS